MIYLVRIFLILGHLQSSHTTPLRIDWSISNYIMKTTQSGRSEHPAKIWQELGKARVVPANKEN